MKFYWALYIYFYIGSLLSFNYLLTRVCIFRLRVLDLPYILIYIMRFSKLKKLYYSLLVSLTGLPLFIVFFIRFNFLLEVYGGWVFYFSYIVFLIAAYINFYYTEDLVIKDLTVRVNRSYFIDYTLSFRASIYIYTSLFLYVLSVFFLPHVYFFSTYVI
jgi:hypothetical protein